jgi:hypothetical protein
MVSASARNNDNDDISNDYGDDYDDDDTNISPKLPVFKGR